MLLKLGGIEYHNKTSAPWMSTEVFVQGCYKNCPGCFNQTLRPIDGPCSIMGTADLVDDLIRNVPYKRVTFSGGEPMLQARKLSVVASELKRSGFVIVCYTGYQAEELPHLFPYSVELLQHVDVLVDGMFIQELLTPIDEPYKFVGSSNQRVINVQKSLDEGYIVLWTEEDTRRVIESERELHRLVQT